MSPVLTEEQRQALAEREGGPVYVIDTVSQRQYVLVPAESFERIRSLFGGEDPFDIRDTYRVQDQAAEQAWNHPGDAAYDDYDAHREQL